MKQVQHACPPKQKAEHQPAQQQKPAQLRPPLLPFCGTSLRVRIVHANQSSERRRKTLCLIYAAASDEV